MEESVCKGSLQFMSEELRRKRNTSQERPEVNGQVQCGFGCDKFWPSKRARNIFYGSGLRHSVAVCSQSRRSAAVVISECKNR